MKNSNLLLFNKNIDKNQIKVIIEWYIINFGSFRTQKVIDKLKVLGFTHATNLGISLSTEDLKVPPLKKETFNSTRKNIIKTDLNYKKGTLNSLKKTERINQIWNNTNNILKNDITSNYKQIDILNPLYMMILSGARGNISQIKQLVGMRGLMADSNGEIINLPITSNFKEGLNIVEYFISCYGARKGLVDTALKTANSGYLTRKLIYTSQNQIITKQNCKTNFKKLIFIKNNNKHNYNKTKELILGQVNAKKLLTKNGTIINQNQDICNVCFVSLQLRLWKLVKN